MLAFKAARRDLLRGFRRGLAYLAIFAISTIFGHDEF